MSVCPHCQSKLTTYDRLPLVWQRTLECPNCETELQTAEHHCALNMIGLGTLVGALGAGVLHIPLSVSMLFAFVLAQLAQAYAGPLELAGVRRIKPHQG